MTALRESATAVIVRGEHWQGEAASEPYEASWASEAVVFLRLLKLEGEIAGTAAAVQISPDGMTWVDEGTLAAFPATVGEVTFARIAHFGGWLRLRASLAEGVRAQVLATLHLKA